MENFKTGNSIENSETGKFEVHIAVPRLSKNEMLFAAQELVRNGITGIDYFLPSPGEALSVRNYRLISGARVTPEACSAEISRKVGEHINGHDLNDPGIMASVYCGNVDEAIVLVRKAMKAMYRLGIPGANFEIEKLIQNRSDAIAFDSHEVLSTCFQGVVDAPAFETHVLYSGKEGGFPSDKVICSELDPHQIVSFLDAQTSQWCIAATVYNSTVGEAIETLQRFQNAQLTGKPTILAEQVLIVGEFAPDFSGEFPF